MMSRYGGNIYDGVGADHVPDAIPWGKTIDSQILGDIMAYGFFIIILAQLIGYLLGENSNVQNGVLALIGGICYIAIGSVQIHTVKESAMSGKYRDLILANSSLAIIQGFLVLVDAAFCALAILKGDK